MRPTRYRGYIQKSYKFADSIEIERYHTGRYGAPGEKRQKRRKATPEEIKRQNQINKANRIRRLIKKNFDPERDYWITLTYEKGTRRSVESVEKDVSNFIRRIKCQYIKHGNTFKWIVRVGVGERGAAHIHMVINRIPDTDIIVAKEWDKVSNAGHIDWQLLHLQGDFRELANYIVKEENGYSTYRRSRNLQKVEPVKREIRTKYMLDVPKPYQGYYVDLESIVTGINPVTGYRYQHFTMIRTKGRSRGSG